MTQRADAEIAWRNGRFAGFPHPFVGILCFAPEEEQSFRPQVAGLNAASFTKTDQEFSALLNAGNTIQFGSSGDISMFCGARFEKVIMPGDSAISYVIIGADTSRTLLAEHLKSAIETIEGVVSVHETFDQDQYIVSENTEFLVFEFCDQKKHLEQTYSLINLQGMIVSNGHLIGGSIHIKKNDYPNGFYVLKIHGSSPNMIPCIVNR